MVPAVGLSAPTSGAAPLARTFSMNRTPAQNVKARGQVRKKKTVSDMLKEIAAARSTQITIKKNTTALPEVAQQKRPTVMPMYEVKPPRSGDLFHDAGTDEEKLEQITDQGIEQLYKLSQQYNQSKNRGELWLRLAELYVEKSKYIEYRLQRDYDRKLELYFQKKAPQPKLNLSKSKEYNLKAIKLYEWFLRDFRNDPKTDQAMFFLGYNYVELEQVKKGIGFYEQLTKTYPNSSYVGEAHFALGEYYFDNDKWADALKSYSDVLKNRRARLYTFALYKIAWCQYRLSRVGQGLKTLEEVIRLSRGAQEDSQLAGKKVVNKIRLGSETLKDIVLFFADVGNYKNAREYFLHIGGDKAQYPMLEKLAFLYSDQGRREQSLFIFKQLLEYNPTAPKAFDYQYQIVTNFATSKDQRIYRDELYTWIDNYGPESVWAKANQGNKKLVEDAYHLRESTLRNYTLLLHKNAQNSQRKPDMIATRHAYTLYLEKFSDSPKSPEMHFFYAELIYAMGEYDVAGKEYRIVAEKEPKGKYFDLSVLNSLLSLEKALKNDDEIKQIVGDSLEPAPFGEAELAFIAAAQRYITVVPKGEKVVDVKFKIGRLHYVYNHFEDAIKIFRQIISQYPKTQFAVYSANLILDIYNLRKDYDNLSNEGLSLMKNKALTEQGFQADVKDLVEKASFKKALDLEVGKNYEGSAKAFATFAQNYPRSPLAISAAFNAGVNYERAHKFPEAIAMYSRVGHGGVGKGNDKVQNNSLLLLGRLYEQSGQYDKAAVQFEKYAKDNPHDKLTPDLYYNSAIIWEGQKEYSRAISDYQKYFERSRRHDKSLALYSIAQIHEKMGHSKAAQDGYNTYLNSGANDSEKIVEANFRIADIDSYRGRNSDAEKGYRKTVGSAKHFAGKGKPAGIVWAAEAKFKLTDAIYNDFQNVNIPHNPKKQSTAIQNKFGLLAKLGNNLAEVIKYDEGNMVIASLCRLGQANEHMYKALAGVPLPTDLNKEELESYRKKVEAELLGPQKQKALDNYVSAINKSYEINYYNKWTKIALDAMSKYQPAKYAAPLEVVTPQIRYDEMGMM